MQLTSGFLFSVGDFDGDENDDDDGDDDDVVQNSGGHFGKFLRCRDLPKTEIGVVAKKVRRQKNENLFRNWIFISRYSTQRFWCTEKSFGEFPVRNTEALGSSESI